MNPVSIIRLDGIIIQSSLTGGCESKFNPTFAAHQGDCSLYLTTHFLVFIAAFKGQACVFPEGHRDGVRTLGEGEAISVQVCRWLRPSPTGMQEATRSSQGESKGFRRTNIHCEIALPIIPLLSA